MFLTNYVVLIEDLLQIKIDRLSHSRIYTSNNFDKIITITHFFDVSF